MRILSKNAPGSQNVYNKESWVTHDSLYRRQHRTAVYAVKRRDDMLAVNQHRAKISWGIPHEILLYTPERGIVSQKVDSRRATVVCCGYPIEPHLVRRSFTDTNIEWDPSFELESTATLLAEFGLFGVLIDPLILQVPDDASNVQATFQNDPTPRDAVITVVDSFPVQPGIEVTAEPGHTFVILEFPDDVPPTLPDGDPQSGEEFDFDLNFDVPTLEPVDVKAMFTGKVEIGGLTYYIPLYPCVTDFSMIPSIQIPVDASPQFLTPQIVNHINAQGDMTCNDQVYDFSGVTLVYLPAVFGP